MPGYNTDSAFLRGGGGKGAAVGTLQQDAAPNITGKWGGIYFDIPDTGAVTQSNQGSAMSAGGSQTWNLCRNIDFNASRSSAVYGRATEVRPVNYTVFYYLKY
jgi:hypothetical protein